MGRGGNNMHMPRDLAFHRGEHAFSVGIIR
jgi:hypothetical protein